MIVAAFISHDDDWILPAKLMALSEFCDRICVVLDRSPQSEAICRRFPRVEVKHVDSDPAHVGWQRGQQTFSEGRLRQAAWDMASALNPRLVVLGDTDEIPAPSIVETISGMRDDVQLVYAHWKHLVHDAGHYIHRNTVHSCYQTIKGVVVRYDPQRTYRYQTDKTIHTRLEPSPLHKFKAVCDKTHVMAESPDTPLVHYRWSHWERWQASAQAQQPEFIDWPRGAEILDTPQDWLWHWDADKLLRSLPEPIAVVGNGQCWNRGVEIDDHATVIRLNNWRTEDYEPHVGARTDAWFTNCWDDVEHRDWTGPMFTHRTHNEQPARVDLWRGMYPHLHTPLSSWVEPTRKWKAKHPSSGLCLLARLVHHGKRFEAFGFDGMASGHYWNSGHQHDHPPEQEALEALIRDRKTTTG